MDLIHGRSKLLPSSNPVERYASLVTLFLADAMGSPGFEPGSQAPKAWSIPS